MKEVTCIVCGRKELFYENIKVPYICPECYQKKRIEEINEKNVFGDF